MTKPLLAPEVLYHCRASVVMFQASEVLDLSEVKLAMRLPKV